jgi:hypothetical protein
MDSPTYPRSSVFAVERLSASALVWIGAPEARRSDGRQNKPPRTIVYGRILRKSRLQDLVADPAYFLRLWESPGRGGPVPGSPSEHDINSRQQELQLSALKLACQFGQKFLIQSNDLRDVRHGILRKPCNTCGREMLPGASAHRRLLVRGTHTTVAIRLRFRASPGTTTTGLLNPGPDPVGAGRSAHQTSPCEITTRFSPEYGGRPRK